MYAEIFEWQAEIYKSLANPKRLEIIHLLRNQELSVSQMMRMLNLPQANLSQHLQVLRDGGLVETRREGKEIYYRLAHKNLILASDLVREMLVDQHQGEEGVEEELRMRMKDLVPLVVDPVCGMRLSPKTAAFALKHEGGMVYFCAAGCKEEFEKKPERYLKESNP